MKKYRIQKCFSLPQQGVPSNAIFFSTYALKDNSAYNNSRPLILLGPNEPAEASSVLNVVRFYKKFMVRNVITEIIVSWRTSHQGGRGRDSLLASLGAVYNQAITVHFRKYPPLPQNKDGWW